MQDLLTNTSQQEKPCTNIYVLPLFVFLQEVIIFEEVHSFVIKPVLLISSLMPTKSVPGRYRKLFINQTVTGSMISQPDSAVDARLPSQDKKNKHIQISGCHYYYWHKHTVRTHPKSKGIFVRVRLCCSNTPLQWIQTLPAALYLIQTLMQELMTAATVITSSMTSNRLYLSDTWNKLHPSHIFSLPFA